MEPRTHGTFISILGFLILCVALVLGGMYLWGSTLTPDDLSPQNDQATDTTYVRNPEPETPRTNADIQAATTLSPSDELSDISADLDATNVDLLNTELQSMDAELHTFETHTR